MQECCDFAGGHKGTIIRIKQVLNSSGSMVGEQGLQSAGV